MYTLESIKYVSIVHQLLFRPKHYSKSLTSSVRDTRCKSTDKKIYLVLFLLRQITVNLHFNKKREHFCFLSTETT